MIYYSNNQASFYVIILMISIVFLNPSLLKKLVLLLSLLQKSIFALYDFSSVRLAYVLRMQRLNIFKQINLTGKGLPV